MDEGDLFDRARHQCQLFSSGRADPRYGAGDVVTYLFMEDRGGPMGSSHRRDALKLIEGECPSGYTILKDGEVQGYSSMSSVEGAEGEVSGRRWGIQFRCK